MMKYHFCLLPLMLLLSACDADKELDKAFANAGLARINAPRTDYAPGAVILKGQRLTVYANNMTDYVDKALLTVQNQDRTNDVKAVLPKLSITKNISPSLATAFVASAIPLTGSINLKFTSKVDMDQMNCRVASIKIVDLQKFLKEPNNAAFASALKGFAADEKADIYIAYEVWSASSLTFSASTTDNIDPEVKVGEIKPLLTSADAKFTYSKTTDKSIKITGDQFYPFALRLAKVAINKQTGALSITLTNFKLNIDVKAAADESYSALPNPDGSALSITAVSKEQLKSTLMNKQ